MRVDALRRAQYNKQSEKTHADAEVTKAHAMLEEATESAKDAQKTGLHALMSGQSIGPNILQSFSTLQKKGIQQIKEASTAADNAQHAYEQATSMFHKSVEETRRGEKKMFAIEEALKEWSSV